MYRMRDKVGLFLCFVMIFLSMANIIPAKADVPGSPLIWDFNDGTAPGWTVSKGQWSVNPITRTYNQTNIHGSSTITSVGEYDWSNYSVEADIKATSRETYGGKWGFGLVLGLTDPETSRYLLYFAHYNDARNRDVITLGVRVGSTQSTWYDYVPANLPPLELNRTYHFMAVMTDDYLEVYIDDEKMATINLPAEYKIKAGKIGLTTEFCIVEFDNVVVKSPPGKPGEETPIPSSSPPATPTPTPNPTPDVDPLEYKILRDKWKEYLIGGISYDVNDPINAAKIDRITDTAQQLWDSMNKSLGRTYLWSHLTSSTNPDDIRSMYNNLKAMALAYCTKGSPLENNNQFLNDIKSALDWLYDNKYNSTKNEYGNWYPWEIAIPLALNDIVVLLYEELEPLVISKNMATIRRFVPDVTRYNLQYPMFSTGANRVWLCMATALMGVNDEDGNSIAIARDGLDIVFEYVTSGDGFYEDGSFIQHDRHPYTGSYGSALLGELAKMMYLFKDSPWEITNSNHKNIFRWVYDSFDPLIFKGSIMDMVRGREIARSTSSNHGVGHSIIGTVALLSLLADEADAKAYRSMVKSWIEEDTCGKFFNGASLFICQLAKEILSNSSPRGEIRRYKQFPAMDRAVFTRPGFSFGISMYSNRIENYEYMNNENKKGWHTSSGMTMLLNSDVLHYDDNYWPTVDAYRLPGTTALQNTGENPDSLNLNSWAGGVELLGLYGTSGMILAPSGQQLQTKKSWFMFDDEIVAMGDVTSNDNKVVETTIENRKLNANGDNALAVNGNLMPSNLGWSQTLSNVSSIHLAGNVPGSDIGYYFPSPATVKALRQSRTGSWSELMNGGSSNSITRNYMTLWFDHGINSSHQSYSYVLLPNKSAAEVEAYSQNPDITILKNTQDIHAVRENKRNITAVNFWTGNGTIEGVITCDKKAAVMMQDNPGQDLSIAVSDPTQSTSGNINIEIYRQATGIIECDKQIQVMQLSPTIKLSINVNNAKGRTFSISWITDQGLGFVRIGFHRVYMLSHPGR